jgi:GrpB-like predicted nucleotidyltransferase (UPF0157 family)
MSPAGSEYEPQLTTEDDLQAITIAKVIPHNGPITLAEYNPSWPALFAREAARIRAVLGDAAVRVEHVGSTSVPGLAAKPVIDILLAVPDSAGEQAYAPALEAAGYVLRIREPDWFEHRLFTGPDTAINLHVFTVGAAEIDRMLLFRDRLRQRRGPRRLPAGQARPGQAYLAARAALRRLQDRHRAADHGARPRGGSAEPARPARRAPSSLSPLPLTAMREIAADAALISAGIPAGSAQNTWF